ncbi:MAG: phosphatase PAP2 family protein [Planctomycetaceae bacterium]|nr:phosphatase PAP2 family protein [Planctomycetaceae bacterium]
MRIRPYFPLFLMGICLSGCVSFSGSGKASLVSESIPSRAKVDQGTFTPASSGDSSLAEFRPSAVLPDNEPLTVVTLNESEQDVEDPDVVEALAYLDAANAELAEQIGYDAESCSQFEDALCGSSCPDTFFARMVEDHRNFYSKHNLQLLGLTFLLAAPVANSSADREILDAFDDTFNSGSGNAGDFVHQFKDIGDHMVMVPIYGASMGAGLLLHETNVGDYVGEWGERSLRATIVGFPSLIFTQKMTGAGRPEEGDSDWSFWNDTNGVSGHSFIGAIPFMTAAQQTDDPWKKTLLYAASTLVPISRITDHDHYPSQSFLGWWMAFSSVMSVDATQDGDTCWRTVPLIGPDYSGLNLEIRW